MDGYAARAVDLSAGRALKVIGEAPAGRAFAGRVGPGEAVRIFTGAPVPEGADTIFLQENAIRTEEGVTPTTAEAPGRHIRPAGLDFAEGDVLLRAGRRLDPRAVALAAAMGHASIPVWRRPKIALLATGDELVRPGEAARPDQIVASNIFAVAGLAEAAGGEAIDLGIATDDFPALERGIAQAEAMGADVIVTLGGASVGDHDLVQSALTARGMELGFWRVAMRPGKPLIFGRLGRTRILGLPGNPVSAIVCGRLFLTPLVRALCGDPEAGRDPSEPATLAEAVPANDKRQDYVRVRITGRDAHGLPLVAQFPRQDSSMLRVFAEADALLIRPPEAPAASAGETVRIIRL
jgi:molybdopterin molybdotransferase